MQNFALINIHQGAKKNFLRNHVKNSLKVGIFKASAFISGYIFILNVDIKVSPITVLGVLCLHMSPYDV